MHDVGNDDTGVPGHHTPCRGPRPRARSGPGDAVTNAPRVAVGDRYRRRGRTVHRRRREAHTGTDHHDVRQVGYRWRISAHHRMASEGVVDGYDVSGRFDGVTAADGLSEAPHPSSPGPTTTAPQPARSEAPAVGSAPGAGGTSMSAGGAVRESSTQVWSAAPLHAAVDALGTVDLEDLDRTALQALLVELRGPLRRLEAARARIAGALQRREQSDAGVGAGPSAGERPTREFLTGELGLTPAEAREVSGTGRRLADAPATNTAFSDGRLTAKHASVITETLPHLPEDRRDAVEAELIDLAATCDPVALGRHARRLIAEADASRLRTLERRQRSRRRFSYHHTSSGGLRFSGELYGTDAEVVRTAFAAFTPAPTRDDTRTHDQRRADGLVTLANASLRAGAAPTQHGVRPHVTILVSADELARQRGGTETTARLGGGETVTLSDVRYLLGDCDVTRVVLDASGAPIAASAAVRTVPVGLWRALIARDQGCTWEGCSAPAAWCDVAHLATPFAAGGRLSPDSAALLCRRHHRRFDAGGWSAVVDGDTVTFTPDPDRPPVAELVRQHSHRQPSAGHARTSAAPEASVRIARRPPGASTSTRASSPSGDPISRTAPVDPTASVDQAYPIVPSDPRHPPDQVDATDPEDPIGPGDTTGPGDETGPGDGTKHGGLRPEASETRFSHLALALGLGQGGGRDPTHG